MFTTVLEEQLSAFIHITFVLLYATKRNQCAATNAHTDGIHDGRALLFGDACARFSDSRISNLGTE